MVIGLILLPVGLVFACTAQSGPHAKHGSYVEHVCLAVGAGIFLLGRMLEKKNLGGR